MKSLWLTRAVACAAFVILTSSSTSRAEDDGAKAPTTAAFDDESQQIAALLSRLIKAGKSITTHEAQFHRREFHQGKEGDAVVVTLRHRTRTGDVYMKWLNGSTKGRELLYTPSTNRVAVTVMFVTLHFSPTDQTIRDASRHPISDVGIVNLVRLIARDYAIAKARDFADVDYKFLGPQRHFGRPTTCFEVNTPKAKEPKFYAVRSVVCVDDGNGLPIYVKVWDTEAGALRMVEEIGYEKLCVNPTFGPEVFTEENPAYGF